MARFDHCAQPLRRIKHAVFAKGLSTRTIAPMSRELLIAGGGIGGMAAALACARVGWVVDLHERSDAFGEVGAGIQLGPNVVRVLEGWGLTGALERFAAFPPHLAIRDALNGRELGRLDLGESVVRRYGARYATIHRADMHSLLLQALQDTTSTRIHLSNWISSFELAGDRVVGSTITGMQYSADALIGADGLWSRVREVMLGDGTPRFSGHLAYRALVAQSDLPASLRSQHVTSWLGPRFHVVQYPVKAGRMLNVVAVVHGRIDQDLDHWDHGANAAALQAALFSACAPLRQLIAAVPAWRLWALCDRPPVGSAQEMALGRVALLGDAAHPMRPYLAQGAGMAIEDAAVLAQSLEAAPGDVPSALEAYAKRRWQRCARVQARSARNGRIFHARGPMKWGRDWTIAAFGRWVLDVPWLYRGYTAS